MNKVASKLGKVLKSIGIVLLVVVSMVTWTRAGASQLKANSSIICEADNDDTIISGQERCRVRVFLDVLKKKQPFSGIIQSYRIWLPPVDFRNHARSFISFYQRNVFYIHTPSSVP